MCVCRGTSLTSIIHHQILLHSEESDPTSKISRNSAYREKRPFLASHCEHLADAEHFRKQILREISEGVKKIQNAGLGEHAIRDLNDTINKLIREKYHWNRRILELSKGKKDYNKEERKAMILAEKDEGGGDGDIGSGLKGSGGYRYFGAAKVRLHFRFGCQTKLKLHSIINNFFVSQSSTQTLPGVKELFARQAQKLTKRKRGDIYKYITPDYYGLRDDEDGVLLELEGEMAAENQKKLRLLKEEYKEIKNNANEDADRQCSEEISFYEEVGNGIPAHLAVPSPEVVATVLLKKKKDALLDRFM